MNLSRVDDRLRRSRVSAGLDVDLDHAVQSVLLATVALTALVAAVLGALKIATVPGAMKLYTGALAVGCAGLSAFLAASLRADALAPRRPVNVAVQVPGGRTFPA